MLRSYNNFIQRSITILICVPVIILTIYWSEWSYFSLFFYIVLLSMLEFYKLVKLSGASPLRGWGVVMGLAIYTITFICLQQPMWMGWLYLFIPYFLLTFVIKLYTKKSSNPFSDIAYTFLGIFYIALPFASLHFIAFSKGYYSYEIVLGILFIVWANDIGAYLVGSTMGRHKLFQRISPSKTWEGIVGGLLASLITGYVLSKHFVIWSCSVWLGISFVVIVAGTYGDLVESLFKRSITIQDASNMIPGHGGFLDRIDSLVMTIPLILTLIKLCIFI